LKLECRIGVLENRTIEIPMMPRVLGQALLGCGYCLLEVLVGFDEGPDVRRIQEIEARA
jgi:hypothetical protein